MLRKRILLTTALLLALAATAYSADKDDKVENFANIDSKLKVGLDLSYWSKWLTKGSEGYGQQGAFFKTLDVDLYGSGFGIRVTHRNAIGSGYVSKQRFDYRPYYKGTAFDGERYLTKYDLSVGYEHYNKVSRFNANTTWEWVLSLAWPKLLGNGLTPCYIAHYEYPAENNTTAGSITGWVHRFNLSYAMDVEQLAKPLNLSAEVAYNDGLGGKGHDWSYFTVGASTSFDIGDGLTLVPGVYHQTTLDKRIASRDDITYAKVSLKYKF